jgi:hypothetical protein
MMIFFFSFSKRYCIWTPTCKALKLRSLAAWLLPQHQHNDERSADPPNAGFVGFAAIAKNRSSMALI